MNQDEQTTELRDLQVAYHPVTSLKLRQQNPRTHSPRQIRQIAESIRTFGWTNPVLIDAQGVVIAGHGRVLAARELGIAQVPVIRLDDLSEAQIRAYVIADNKLAENAGWDEELLALELQGLADLELDFDLTVLGFETAEIDLMIGEDPGEASDEADHVAEPDPDTPPVSRPGDLWRIGRHRLICADATDGAAFSRLMAGAEADMVFTDPPYNVPIEGHASGLGRIRHADFAMAAGEMDAGSFTGFLERVLGHHIAHSRDGAIHFVCMDWRHLGELLAATRGQYAELKNLCVWTKTNAGMGSLYRSQHELVFVLKAGRGSHINNVELGRHGRNRSNVWRYAGASSLGPDRAEALALHPTVKPVALVADAILDCSRRGGIVLDGFAGAGTTLLAAERSGRVGCGIEMEPLYVDASIRRLARHAGLDAVHAESGLSFTEIEAARTAKKGTQEATETSSAASNNGEDRIDA